MKHTLPLLAIALLAFSSCKVEFSPNAPWRDVPSVYCVLDIESDTVWARVQRCYLGEDNLYNYSTIADSNYYLPDDISVHLLAWKGIHGPYNSITATNTLVDRWEFTYTERPGKPDGNFPSGIQPLYYCTPGQRFVKDSDCVFQIVVLRNPTGDTLAKATTTMVGFIPLTIHRRDTSEDVLINPSSLKNHEFGYIIGCRGYIDFYTLPRGRLYQPYITFYYEKNHDTLGFDIFGGTTSNPGNASRLTSTPISQQHFLSVVKSHLLDNTDTLYNVNHVDIHIAVCNEDLSAYIKSQDPTVTGGQDFHSYSNIEGGVGIFGSRREHIVFRVPCDSTGKEGYLPSQLRNLGVGFYGYFGQDK